MYIYICMKLHMYMSLYKYMTCHTLGGGFNESTSPTSNDSLQWAESLQVIWIQLEVLMWTFQWLQCVCLRFFLETKKNGLTSTVANSHLAIWESHIWSGKIRLKPSTSRTSDLKATHFRSSTAWVTPTIVELSSPYAWRKYGRGKQHRSPEIPVHTNHGLNRCLIGTPKKMRSPSVFLTSDAF